MPREATTRHLTQPPLSPPSVKRLSLSLSSVLTYNTAAALFLHSSEHAISTCADDLMIPCTRDRDVDYGLLIQRLRWMTVWIQWGKNKETVQETFFPSWLLVGTWKGRHFRDVIRLWKLGWNGDVRKRILLLCGEILWESRTSAWMMHRSTRARCSFTGLVKIIRNRSLVFERKLVLWLSIQSYNRRIIMFLFYYNVLFLFSFFHWKSFAIVTC